MLPHDSGKTSVTAALVREARRRGADTVAAKPVGGHCAWRQFDTLSRSLDMGILVGEDAYKLWLASDKCEPIELISPLDILTAPPDPDAIGLDGYSEESSILTKVAVLLRISDAAGKRTEHYVVSANLKRVAPALRARVEELARRVRAKPVSPAQFLKLATSSEGIVDESLQLLLDRHEEVFVESFNDAACPAPACLEADAVILVAPSRAYVYRGSDYAAVVRELARRRGLNVTSQEVFSRVTPIGSVQLVPRRKSELTLPSTDTVELLNLVKGMKIALVG